MTHTCPSRSCLLPETKWRPKKLYLYNRDIGETYLYTFVPLRGRKVVRYCKLLIFNPKMYFEIIFFKEMMSRFRITQTSLRLPNDYCNAHLIVVYLFINLNKSNS